MLVLHRYNKTPDMKTLMMILAVIGACSGKVMAQTYMSVDRNHIQSPPNASYQNNSQFYNKDNKITYDGANMNSNGTYWQPGYSNDANRNRVSSGVLPSTSVNSSNNTSSNSYYNSTINNSSTTPNNGGGIFRSNDVVTPSQMTNPSNNIGRRP
jgi:hypothetical protein